MMISNWCGCVCMRQSKRQQDRAHTLQVTALDDFSSVSELRTVCCEGHAKQICWNARLTQTTHMHAEASQDA